MFLFALAYGDLHGTQCDWCPEAAVGLIYSDLSVQHTCEEHLGDWLHSQAEILGPPVAAVAGAV